MPQPFERIFSLPAEQAGYTDTLIASGNDASAGEVVRASLRALQERAVANESWLQQDVLATYDAMQADPSRGISANDVAASLLKHHTATRASQPLLRTATRYP